MSPLEEVTSLATEVADRRRAHRPLIMEETAAGAREPELALRQLDAMRWVDRVTYHWWRALHHLSGSGARAGGSTQVADSYVPQAPSTMDQHSAAG